MLDFGLAKLIRDGKLATSEETPVEDSLTAVGVIPGTAVYMSPEQARSDELDPRSDLFSFGVVLYEMATGKKPFAGNNVVMTLDAVLHQKPLSPLKLNPAMPTDLEGIVGKAMEKDRNKRYQTALEIKADLQRLKKETESGLTRTGPREMTPMRVMTGTFEAISKPQKYLLLAMTALLLTVLVAVGAWWFKRRAAGGVSQQEQYRSLAAAEHEWRFQRGLSALRIGGRTGQRAHLYPWPGRTSLWRHAEICGADADPQQVGRELHVANVVTGHFLKQGNELLVTLEAVDATSDRLLWQTNLSVPDQDLISLQEQLTQQVRRGLLPILGAAGGYLDTGTRPKNQEAYDLYLHSLALPHDPNPNKDAIAVLEHVVATDPNYAPAWEELGLRYYYHATYSNGGENVFQRSNSSYERALELDPNRILAAGKLITNRVERGEVARAYQEAKALVKRRPESAEAHFTLAFVLRYAGMLEEAVRECDNALALDPGNYTFRSCTFAFQELDQPGRAMDFLRLDAGSEYANYALPYLLLREGKVTEAREAVKKMATTRVFHRDLLQACLSGPPSELDRIAHEDQTGTSEADPELVYDQGAILAYCGKKEAAFHMLRTAIEQNYCAYSNLLSDPLLTKLRSDSRFDEILTAAHECQLAVQSGPPANPK